MEQYFLVTAQQVARAITSILMNTAIYMYTWFQIYIIYNEMKEKLSKPHTPRTPITWQWYS